MSSLLSYDSDSDEAETPVVLNRNCVTPINGQASPPSFFTSSHNPDDTLRKRQKSSPIQYNHFVSLPKCVPGSIMTDPLNCTVPHPTSNYGCPSPYPVPSYPSSMNSDASSTLHSMSTSSLESSFKSHSILPTHMLYPKSSGASTSSSTTNTPSSLLVASNRYTDSLVHNNNHTSATSTSMYGNTNIAPLQITVGSEYLAFPDALDVAHKYEQESTIASSSVTATNTTSSQRSFRHPICERL